MSAGAKLVLKLRIKQMIKTVEAVIDERGNVRLLDRCVLAVFAARWR
jgi:hypothetical protein